MKLSEHFTLEELCKSATATAKKIKNVPNAEQTECLKELAVNVLEPLRVHYGKPILIGSGFRCLLLNKAVGGVPTSQHAKGQAADLYIEGDKKRGQEWFNYIKNNLPFDQLIWEHNSKGTYWVHVSYKKSGNRKMVIDNLLKKS